MAIPDRVRGESVGATRVDSGPSYRSPPFLKLVDGPATCGDLVGVDSGGTSQATPAVAWTAAVETRSGGVGTPPRHNSAAYFAAIRRGEIQKISELILSLDQQMDREDYAVCFFPIVDRIRLLLDRLTDADREGNTREILRRLRDTFLDGGWSRYRDPGARVVAEQVVEHLARADGVTPDDVKRFTNLIRTTGLKAAGMPLYDLEDESEGEEIDVDEEEEVLDRDLRGTSGPW